MDHQLQQVLACLRPRRFDFDNEKVLQKQMEEAFRAAGIAYQREVRLSPTDIIDFMVGNIGIEVKIKSAKKAIYKQCVRYCQQEQVGQLLLLTNKQLGFPDSINGKPTHILNLGLAWL